MVSPIFPDAFFSVFSAGASCKIKACPQGSPLGAVTRLRGAAPSRKPVSAPFSPHLHAWPLSLNISRYEALPPCLLHQHSGDERVGRCVLLLFTLYLARSLTCGRLSRVFIAMLHVICKVTLLIGCCHNCNNCLCMATTREGTKLVLVQDWQEKHSSQLKEQNPFVCLPVPRTLNFHTSPFFSFNYTYSSKNEHVGLDR